MKIKLFFIGVLFPTWAYANVTGSINWAEQVLTILFALIAALYAAHTTQYRKDHASMAKQLETVKADQREMAKDIHSISIAMVQLRVELAENYVKRTDIRKPAPHYPGHGYA